MDSNLPQCADTDCFRDGVILLNDVAYCVVDYRKRVRHG